MRQTTIHQPAPCHESWEGMAPAATGRHCAACQKVVVDFTQMTDGAVVAFLHQYASTSCGRFQTSQLNRPLLPATPPVAGWQRWLGATLTLLGAGAVLGLKAHAQNNLPVQNGGPVPAGAIQNERSTFPVSRPDTKLPAAQTQAVAQFLRGTVLDSATQQGLPGVTVFLEGTTLGVSTDVDGNFQLSIPAQEIDSVRSIVFSYIGYQSVKQPLPAPTASQPMKVELTTRGVSVSTGIIVLQRPPWYSPAMLRYRVRQLFHRH